jgi:hypothetical protein
MSGENKVVDLAYSCSGGKQSGRRFMGISAPAFAAGSELGKIRMPIGAYLFTLRVSSLEAPAYQSPFRLVGKDYSLRLERI